MALYLRSKMTQLKVYSFVSLFCGMLILLCACSLPQSTPQFTPTDTPTPVQPLLNVACNNDDLIDAINIANANPSVLNTLVLASGCVYDLSEIASHTYSDGLRIRLPIITTRIEIKGNDSTLAITSGGGRIMHIHTSGYVKMQDLTFSGADTHASGSHGGAIFNYGILDADNTHFMDNTAASQGGAIYNDRGTLSISNSTFTNNRAANGGALTFNFGNPGEAHGLVNIENTEFSTNVSSGDGGAIYTSNGYPAKPGLRISESIFSQNLAQRYGGALRHGSNVVTQIEACTFEDNHARKGGAILSKAAHEPLIISQSTIANNLASEEGGGIYNLNKLTIKNSTISGNSGSAAGVHTVGGTVNIKFSTISNNNGMGLLATDGASPLSISVESVIIADNTGDCDGTSISSMSVLGDNLDSDSSCPGFTLSGDPELLPLADNGGPTRTHALLPGSPAVDVVDPITCLSYDQRSEIRPKGTLCDLGAFELEYVTPPGIEPQQLIGIVLELSACREGPGEPYANISSLQAGTEVEVVGVGENGDYLIINNPVYNRPCWIRKNIIGPAGLDAETLQVYPIPPLLTTSVPTSQASSLQASTDMPTGGCLVPNLSAPGKVQCVAPCPDPIKYPELCVP